MSDAFGKENQATPTATLEQQILDPNHPKNEREWWAAAEITRLRAEVASLTIDLQHAYGEVNFQTDKVTIHGEAITRLTARVKELEEALNPFADESLWSGPDHEFVTVKRSDCDRARSAITQEKRDE